MARRRPLLPHLLLPLVALGLQSCRSTSSPEDPAVDRTYPTRTAPPRGLVDDLFTSSREEFEATLLGLAEFNLSAGDPVHEADLDELAGLANDPDRHELALRAVLVLDLLEDPRATGRLLTLLELREERPTRPADAALCVAAAAVGRWPADVDHPALADHVARLAALANDADPHPDLEVRVECARSALFLGDESVGPFLLRVLRLGTQLGLDRDGTWRSAITTTWSRHRAGEALADYLGVDTPYHGDAPLTDREDAALELEALWNERR